MIRFALTRSGWLCFCVLLCWQNVLLAQSESDLVAGDWHCDTGDEEPVLLKLAEDDDQITMCDLKDGQPTGATTEGIWKYEDVDYNDDDLAVVTIKVTWDGRNEAADHRPMTVTLTFINDDKVEVRWANEEMRIWTRVKPDDDKDRQE